MPRISVVVPIYNVEPYLEECLASIAGQTFRDFEVVMVDDGSKDGSPAIAERFVAADPRFRLIQQPNGGLGKARNTGIEAATGEFLAFVDSDDYLAENAYELLMDALEESGSDFATGNVRRLQSAGARQVGFLAEAFAKTRLKTHVSQYPPLIADRVAWNKLFRRSFWDEHGGDFPEGVLNEDIPVIVPAHFAARSVDVISDPIYYWRIRDGEQLSITQRRLEPRALLDRMRAIEKVVDWLDAQGNRKWKRWYLESVVKDDLRFYLNPLPGADEEYQQLFLDEVNAFLDRAPKDIFDPMAAIERLKWHLVRRRLLPELFEVIRFQKEDLRETPPVKIRGRWYGDYPFRDDPRLRIPRSVYRLEGELGFYTAVEGLEWDGERLRVRGFAYIRGIGAPAPGTHSLRVIALRRGRLRRVRLRISGVRLSTTRTHRPDVTASSTQSLRDISWSGFEASLDPADLRRAGRLKPGVWELFITARAGSVRRRRARFHSDRMRPLRGVELPAHDGVLTKAVPTGGGGIALDVRDQWITVRSHRLGDGDVLELSGELHGPHGAKPAIEAVRRSDGKTFKYKLQVDGESFTARVRLRDLLNAANGTEGEDAEEADDAEDVDEPDEIEESDRRGVWDLQAIGGGPRRSVGLAEEAGGSVWESDGRALTLVRTRKADAALMDEGARPVVERAEWTGDDVLELAGELPAGCSGQELVLAARDYGDEQAFPVEDTGAGRFAASLAPARIESLAGTLPLRMGNWDLLMRPAGSPDATPGMPVALSHEVYERLPLTRIVERKPFSLGMQRDGRATLFVSKDLDLDESGGYNQRRLRSEVYVARRHEPLRDAVLYTSFHGRQYSDSPRAIHEELVRRGSPLEQLWVVQDGQAAVPPTARVVREASREHHDALASARYIVTNDHFHDWFARRPDQVCLQTWHGVPLKRLGFDVAGRGNTPRFSRWRQQIDNWQYTLSPNRFSTPILRRAYALEGEMLETGYPRSDVLAAAGRDARTRELRRRLGIPEGKRAVLYAPTYRDNVYDRRGRYRLDLQLDLARLRAAVGEDTVILFRKHHYIVDPVPTTADGFVRDVSRYPDGTELMLAADVLITDYSSMMFDFANTGRPMLFFTYDLDAYQDEIRGFYLDYLETIPGPMMRTTGEVADALRDIDSVSASYAGRYERFVSDFCELDDGQASSRVVDRIFSP